MSGSRRMTARERRKMIQMRADALDEMPGLSTPKQRLTQYLCPARGFVELLASRCGMCLNQGRSDREQVPAPISRSTLPGLM
jgi:hypothetical protein